MVLRVGRTPFLNDLQHTRLSIGSLPPPRLTNTESRTLSGVYKPSSEDAQVLSNLLRSFLPLSQQFNNMLFTATLSLLLTLGSSLVAASPISSGVNATTYHRACGTTPSDEFVIQAEDHFAKHKVTAKPDVNIAVASIPVYCALHSSLSFRRAEADTGLFRRACDLQEHNCFWWIHPRFTNCGLHQRHEP